MAVDNATMSNDVEALARELNLNIQRQQFIQQAARAHRLGTSKRDRLHARGGRATLPDDAPDGPSVRPGAEVVHVEPASSAG